MKERTSRKKEKRRSLMESEASANAAPVIGARVIDEKKGICEIRDVRAIRIHSKGYTLLIMADFAPIIGRVEGSVDILSSSGEDSWEEVKGFFKHQRNSFTLLIEQNGPEEANG